MRLIQPAAVLAVVGCVVALDGAPVGAPATFVTAGVGSWGPASGPEGGSIMAVAVDPRNAQTVNAGTGGGVFISGDGGASWHASDGGLSNLLSVEALAIDASGRVLDAGTSCSGVFTSANSGSSWRAAGLDGKCAQALAVDPRNPQTVYAATVGEGLFKTTNGGAGWRRIGPIDTSVNDYYDVTALAIDPRAPATVFVGTDGGVWGA
jgi:photosystem II stability/assembly factor-like uncharacterized protein